jgi:hypothetical protein
MKSRETKLVIIEGCGDELLDAVLNTVNYECSSPEGGAVLTHTDDLDNTTDDMGKVQKILGYLNDPKRNDAGPVSIPYEGMVLLRK